MSETKAPAPSLKALAENKTEGVSKLVSFRVDPDLIHFEAGFNLRTEGDDLDLHIDHLYRAMKAGAFIPPVDVSLVNGEIIARDGHCRARAAQKLKLEMPEFTLECRQLRGNETDAVLHMLGTGSGSKPLTPLEQGRGYLRLIKMGLTPVQIADKLGVSRVTVDNGITLAEAPVEVQKMIEAGEVSSTTARDVVKAGAEAIAALTAAVVEERTNPTPAKKATKKGAKKAAKKKVTAKNLKGTAADKKGKAAKKKAKKPTEPDPMDGPALADIQNAPDGITVTVSKEIAAATIKFLRDFGGEDAALKHMADALESASM